MESEYRLRLYGRAKEYIFNHPLVMGILNVTPDSFYDGGRYMQAKECLHRVEQMLEEGADIIDAGFASSRPGAKMPPAEEEAGKVSEILPQLVKAFPQALFSVDTCYAHTARIAA